MQSRGGMNELMRQAARLQRKLAERRAELKDQEMSATAAGGLVEVTVSCEGKLRAIRVDPRLLAEEGLELTLDGIVAAANSALALADAHVEKELGKATGGLKIPGLT